MSYIINLMALANLHDITGIFNIQTNYNKNCNWNVKLMLVSSATYSKTKASGYSSYSFSEITY